MDILAMMRDINSPPALNENTSVNDTGEDVRAEKLEELDYFKLHPILTILYLIVMSVSTLAGLVGNILVISAVLVHPKLRTKANVYIINLAIADSNVAYVVQIFSIIGLTKGYSFFIDKAWLCHAIATICLISCSCSLWNMATIAVNRYICICKRQLYEKMFNSWRKCILIAILLWVICGLLEMPNYFEWGGHTFDPKTMACSYDRTADYTYTVFFVLVAIGPPLVVVLICYSNIFIQVQASRKEIQKVGAITTVEGGGAKWTKSEVQLAKTLFIIFVVFLICWSPYAVVVLIDINDEWPKIVYVVVIQMAHTNSSLNSIIYAASNKDFRDGYLRVVCFWRKFDKQGNMVPFNNSKPHASKPIASRKAVSTSQVQLVTSESTSSNGHNNM